MLFNSSSAINLFILVLALFIGWIFLLSLFIFKIWRHYNKLTKGVGEKSLSKVLEQLLSQLDKINKEVGKLQRETKTMQKASRRYIQEVKLLRYNPFREVGGDQSFILALLDKEKSGVVISSLHARESTRWFAKKVIKGKGKQHKLSEEEQKVVSS